MNKTIFLGDNYIEVRNGKEGNSVATLHSATSFAMLEIENCDGKVRIKEMELGSAFVDVKHLAILINEAGLKDSLMTALAVVK